MLPTNQPATDGAVELGRKSSTIGTRRRMPKRSTCSGPEAPAAPRLLVDPSECKLWSRHPRLYERLNEHNCADLIDSMVAAGGMHVPAIARPLQTEGPIKYEMITGSRRLWSVRWIRAHRCREMPFYIEIREGLTDEEAFLISVRDNLDRVDLSDYERGLDYRDALDRYYEGKPALMAARMNKSESWVSRYLTLARLPVQVANAYADLRDLKRKHAPAILELLTNPKTAKRVLQTATGLHAEHRAAESAGCKPLAGAEVFERLTQADRSKTGCRRGDVLKAYGGDEAPHLALKRADGSGLSIYVPKRRDIDKDEIVASFRACLDEYLG